MRTSRWIHALREPVPREVRRVLGRAWARLPERLRGPRQFLGRQYAGCGATVGAMPRCDFACTGCYLGTSANRTPALPLQQIETQLRDLRRWLGPGGNVQLTDGELTLRDPEELEALVQMALRLGLQPMLMTHGDHLLHDPERLHRLMAAGLEDLSIHVDVTQRGRRDTRYRRPERERDLHPLRDAFADLIREARAHTGRPLRVATTVTVSAENLEDVPDVVRWVLHNADAFKMVSFQPVAAVGRTRSDLGAISAAELWERIAKGLVGRARIDGRLDSHQGWLGHPDCSRFVQGLVLREADGTIEFVPLLDPLDPARQQALAGLLDRVGGLTFRGDDRATALVRAAALAARELPLLVRSVLPLLFGTWGRLAPEGRLRFAWRWLRGDCEVSYLNLVSHHFMSADELETEQGRERLDVCAFQTSVDGELVSMCELNARGVRERLYERLRSADA